MSDTDDYVRIFSAAAMDETWGRLLHLAVFDEGVTPAFEYEEWMGPLCDIYRKHLWHTAYDGVMPGDVELTTDCKAAYTAGLAGDFDAVDRFVGGYELAHIDELVVINIKGGVAQLSFEYVSLDVSIADGNMKETNPNEANSDIHTFPKHTLKHTSTGG